MTDSNPSTTDYKWKHIRSDDGLTLISTVSTEGLEYSVSMKWDDRNTADKMVEQAKADVEERAALVIGPKLEKEEVASTTVKDAVELFGYKLRLGRSSGGPDSKVAKIALGGREASLNLNEEGKWDRKSINFAKRNPETSKTSLFATSAKNSLWLSVSKSAD
jgi:hypothetical protein